MSDKPKEFFIVISERRGPSMYPVRHETSAKAVTEASRLARENRGEKFSVYKSHCVVKADDVTVVSQSPDFDPFDDEIPF